jgi:hypothetical protein
MFNLADYSTNIQTFYTKGSSNVGDFQIWTKPLNAKFVNIFCLGSGGGGGGGQGGAVATSRRGGGGGGAGGFSIGLFSASQLPDILYLLIPPGGTGGNGGATPSNGTAGAISYVTLDSDVAALNILMASGAAGAGGGNAGTLSGTAGAAGTAWAGSILNNLGLVTARAGQIGVTGQTTTTPAPARTIANIVTGGAAGAGTNTSTAINGGDITGIGFINSVLGGTGNASTAGLDGSSGYSSLNTRLPTFFTGGAGGGSSNSAAGGNGGYGSFGSGGGGGGAGVTSLSGRGGNGGDGLIIITAW